MSVINAMTDADVKREVRKAASKASREVLLGIISGHVPSWFDERTTRYAAVAARQELINRYPCEDCEAPAGQECKPDYGCLDTMRRPSPC